MKKINNWSLIFKMTKKEFENCNVNDKVKCLETFPELPFKDSIGKIIYKDLKRCMLGIEWENGFLLGHDCYSKGKDGFCRNYDFVSKKNDENLIILKLISNQQLELDF